MRNWHGNLPPFGSWHTGRRVFNPLSLFANGEPGVWYDPSDLTTMFTDTAGTTQAAVGQAVALMLDKSKGLALGPELVTNGDFSNGTTGWTALQSATLSVSDGVLRVTNIGGNFGQAGSSFIPTIGKTYEVSATLVAVASGRVGRLAFGGVTLSSSIAVGTYTYITTAVSANSLLLFSSSANAADWSEWDNISVRELPGNHATQAVLSARPILGRVPASGRRNQITFSEQFDDPAFTKVGGTITPNAAVAPDGEVTADQLVEGAGTVNGASIRRTNPSFWFGAMSLSAAISIHAKEVVGSAKRYLVLGADNGSARWAYIIVDLATGAVTATRTDGIQTGVIAGSAVVEPAENGYYRVSLAVSSPLGASNYLLRAGITNTPTPTFTTADIPAYTGDGASGLMLWGLQAEPGSVVSAYQRVGSTFDVTEAGKADLYHLVFDGTDDWLVTPTITPGIDKAQVFAGVRKLGVVDASLIGSSSAPLTQQGTFEIRAPRNLSTSDDYAWFSHGTTTGGARSAGFAAPITNVLTGIGDISGDNATLRVDGTQAAQNTSDQGTGNYLAYPLYIGRRAGTSLPFNGHLYSLIVRFGPNLTSDTIGPTERWVANKTGVTL